MVGLAVTAGPPDIGEGHITLQGPSIDSVVSGTWTVGANSGQYNCGWFYNSSAANGDKIRYHVFLSAGSYTVVLVGNTADNNGISKISVDGTVVLTKDQFSVGAVLNVITTATFTQANSKIVEVDFYADGKNAGSGGYNVATSYIAFFRTA